MSATKGYPDLTRWETIVDEPSKPAVAHQLLAGAYDAGLTHLHHAHEHPKILRIDEVYGAVDTAWVVYGAHKRFRGSLVGRTRAVAVQRSRRLPTQRRRPPAHVRGPVVVEPILG